MGTWGEKAEWLAEIARQTEHLPAALRTKPDVHEFLEPYCEAFLVLMPCRQAGWGLGLIPLSEIRAYVTLFEVKDVECFVRLIRAMDRAYLEAVNGRNDCRTKARL